MSRLALGVLAAFALIGLALAAGGDLLRPDRPGVIARRAAAHPPEFWLAEALDDQGAVRGAVQVCADNVIRSGFLTPLPRLNGEPCRRMGQAVVKPDLYAVRCVALDRRYSVNVTRTGDPARDITVRFALRPLETPDPGVRQAVRYRLIGACPAGWRIGDTVRPGAVRRINALAG
ncbi:hypothetical protein [Phenylobacterium sp.]|uniref:hypothetical protein n=1 Tax=Phenylobacterium sp. TaxID=1871053 RepID=UPI002735074E|nr:hypothetical protein [Phenylobacterium sp.]MDP3853892.1 hypothetical protein [Phenylobacterium sp.]